MISRTVPAYGTANVGPPQQPPNTTAALRGNKRKPLMTKRSWTKGRVNYSSAADVQTHDVDDNKGAWQKTLAANDHTMVERYLGLKWAGEPTSKLACNSDTSRPVWRAHAHTMSHRHLA